MNQIEHKMLQDEITNNKKNLTVFFAIVLLFVIFIAVYILIVNRNTTTELDNNTQVNNTVYSSEGLVTDREPTTLEKIGLKDKMFHPRNQTEIICSNCNRLLSVEDDYFNMVITEADSFVKIMLCENCFVPMKDLLSQIGL